MCVLVYSNQQITWPGFDAHVATCLMKRERNEPDQASRHSRYWNEASSSGNCASKADQDTDDVTASGPEMERDGADPTLAGGVAAPGGVQAAAASQPPAQEDGGSAGVVLPLPGQANERSYPGASGSLQPSEGGWDSKASTVAGEPPAGASEHEAVPLATRQTPGKLTDFDLRVYWFLTTLPEAHQQPVLDLLAAKGRTTFSTWAEAEAVLGKAREHPKPWGLLVQQPARLWLPWAHFTSWCMASLATYIADARKAAFASCVCRGGWSPQVKAQLPGDNDLPKIKPYALCPGSPTSSHVPQDKARQKEIIALEMQRLGMRPSEALTSSVAEQEGLNEGECVAAVCPPTHARINV